MLPTFLAVGAGAVLAAGPLPYSKLPERVAPRCAGAHAGRAARGGALRARLRRLAAVHAAGLARLQPLRQLRHLPRRRERRGRGGPSDPRLPPPSPARGASPSPDPIRPSLDAHGTHDVMSAPSAERAERVWGAATWVLPASPASRVRTARHARRKWTPSCVSSRPSALSPAAGQVAAGELRGRARRRQRPVQALSRPWS